MSNRAVSTKKRKQEAEVVTEPRKRRKGESGKATVVQQPNSLVLPRVKVGKKEVVVNQNWSKVKATLPPTHPGRAKRLERQKKERQEKEQQEKTSSKKKKPSQPVVSLPVSDSKEPTKVLALDCEMVGVGIGGFDSALARVTILNSYGNTIYDKFVRAQEDVVDYRTQWSGVRKEDLDGAPSFKVVQQEVADLIKGRIVVGHGLKNDFGALMLHHPFTHIRDTAKYRPLQRRKGRPYSLKVLTKKLLGVEIQSAEHDSGEDARAALLLYKRFKPEWEKQIESRRYQPKKKKVTADSQIEEKKSEK